MRTPPAPASTRGLRFGPALLFSTALLVFAGTAMTARAADLQAIVGETQKIKLVRKDASTQDMTLMWWIPVEFWEESARQNPNVTPEVIARFHAVLDPYTMVAVASGHLGPFGGMTYESAESVRAALTLKDAQGASYAPLTDAQISADAKNMLGMMKPIIGNMIGQMGQNMNFICFPAKAKDGKRIADARGDRLFSFVLSGQEYKFRVPLGSLMPPKFDAQTHEEFPGNYLYSPFTGTKLVTDAPSAAMASPAAPVTPATLATPTAGSSEQH